VIDVLASDSSGPAPALGPGSGESDVPEQADAEQRGRADGEETSPSGDGFSVHLDEFEGPFDLLLSLISKHKLDVTVLALHTVIDDFLAHIRSRGPLWDLDEATEFLVVAATLLDLKAARLLPSGEVEDEEDLALLEARDLLFARLLQYRAFRDVSELLGEMLRSGGRRRPRTVGLDPQFSDLLPEVLIGLGPIEFAALAGRALAPKPVAAVGIAHIHAPRVSVREQAAVLVDRLRRNPSQTFRHLTADCDSTLLVVARFLALLELYREGSVAFDQVDPLGELHVRWTGPADGEVVVLAEEYEGSPVTELEPEAAAEVTDQDIADISGVVIDDDALSATPEDTPRDETTEADA
jgi:segregation and condensation protein A